MKINYPVIDKDDVQSGDIVVAEWGRDGTYYYEFEVDDPKNLNTEDSIYYLIERPKAVFPEDYGTLIIAKRVRGTSFPDGVTLARQRGGNYPGAYGPLWKSLDRKIEGADNHPETQIHDWVLAKAVPA